MIRWIPIATAIAVAAATPDTCWAQQTSSELLSRIDHIESELDRLRQENADLRSELIKMQAVQPADDQKELPTTSAASSISMQEGELSLPERTSWSGVYVGLGVGQTELRTARTYLDANGRFDFVASSSSRSAIGGVEIGARFQEGFVVAGLGLQGNIPTQEFKTPLFGGQTFELGQSRRIRGTLGLADDRFHVYGTAGIQFTRVKIIQPPALASTVRRANATSFTYGFGSEVRVLNDWSLFLETNVGDANQEGFDNVRIRDMIVGLRVPL